MTARRWFIRDPDSVLDYEIDWSTWLADSETITSAVWTVPDGITKDSDSHTGTAATIWLSGGTAGAVYDITCRITTSAGRTDDRTAQVWVAQR